MSISVTPFTHEALEEETWLDLHRDAATITASQVPVIMGLSRYDSAFALYARKTGALPPVVSTRAMVLGHHMEALLARWYQEDTGRPVQDLGDYTVVRHPENPWLICTPDRLALEGDELMLVELKNSGVYARAAWEAGGDPVHHVQLQVQLACCDLQRGSLAGLAGGWNPDRDFHVIDVDRHDRLLKQVIPMLAEFRERCLKGAVPILPLMRGLRVACIAPRSSPTGLTSRRF